MIDYQKERNKYRPQKITTLLIGEAPPPSGKVYFYVPTKMNTGQSIENDTSLPATIFNHYFGKRPETIFEYEVFLRKLKEMGIFLIDIIDEPIRIRGDKNLTRDLDIAKQWLRKQARGSERYGIVVSSQAERLKPHAIDVKSPMEPVNWFLEGKSDVRSSNYLEDVATEFHIQGLELDWACVTWDADFRYSNNGWKNWSFRGTKWNHINKDDRKLYQKNAYRVLLTRARQGMVIVVPEGDPDDPTRDPEFYNPTYEYLKSIGFEVI